MQHVRRIRERQRAIRWEYVQSILVTVGNMTIAWAGIERMLDELIAWYQQARTSLEREHPINLKNKLEYLRFMQRDPNFTPEIQDFLRTARIEAKRLSGERHNIIHGLLHFESIYTLRWHTQRVVYDGPNAKIEHRTYSKDELKLIAHEISEFCRYLSPRIWLIIDGDTRLMRAHDIKKVKLELGMT